MSTVSSDRVVCIYPEMLRRLADMCDGLNKVDGADSPETNGVVLTIHGSGGLPVFDDDGSVYGYLVDEIGGSWGFRAALHEG